MWATPAHALLGLRMTKKPFRHTWFIIFLIFKLYFPPCGSILREFVLKLFEQLGRFSPFPEDTSLWFNISLKLWCVFSSERARLYPIIRCTDEITADGTKKT